ncbi:MAG TPA: bifunctional phosphopantothenoylcysteine decarboxylase/phosphopantothenate--cysteine ligase CoaBC, partial [Clostridia bacterium]|nr:bifunctional phosphopantothenoylcysteine decarboxylase/phosphopantothenate--cysteine ligase CoaBC [Clostridia bacterium]
LANGIADDSLTTTVMATQAQVIIAPAMNTAMYHNPIVQKNINTLQAFGYKIIKPASGRLACGDVGEGKLADVADIYNEVVQAIERKGDYTGKTVLVTAGPTREAIDPVRYITNHSSGLMGYSIAEEAYERGARVILISGPVALPAPAGVEKIEVESTRQMHEAVMDKLGEADIIIKAAAPADYTVAHKSGQKIKRGGPLALELVENADIAAAVGRNKGRKVLVAFAAESENLRENALKKLKEKNADIIVANDILRVDAGFNSANNAAVVFGRDGYVEELPLMSKREMAKRILDLIKNYE